MEALKTSLIELLQAMHSGMTIPVKLWVGWMSLVFLVSVLFIKGYKPARWVVIALLITMWARLNVWSQVKNIHLIGVAHLLIWLPLAFYLWNSVLSTKSRELRRDSKMFLIWVYVLLLTIFISLGFDIRNIYLVITGVK